MYAICVKEFIGHISWRHTKSSAISTFPAEMWKKSINFEILNFPHFLVKIKKKKIPHFKDSKLNSNNLKKF